MQATLEIVYRAQIGQPLTAAVVENRQLLVEAAKAAIAEAHHEVTVVTADRQLAARVRAARAEVVGPSWLLDRLME